MCVRKTVDVERGKGREKREEGRGRERDRSKTGLLSSFKSLRLSSIVSVPFSSSAYGWYVNCMFVQTMLKGRIKNRVKGVFTD
jgi:hypothetical protein